MARRPKAELDTEDSLMEIMKVMMVPDEQHLDEEERCVVDRWHRRMIEMMEMMMMMTNNSAVNNSNNRSNRNKTRLNLLDSDEDD